MAAISVPCPGCGKLLKTSEAAAGKSGRCPHCRNLFTVPMPSISVPATPSLLDDLLDDRLPAVAPAMANLNATTTSASSPPNTVVQLRCVDRGRKDERWILALYDDKAVVKDSSLKVVSEIAADEAVGRFELPSFSQNVKYFGLRIDQMQMRFDVSKEGLDKIKSFMNQTIAAQGSGAVLAVRNKAIRDLAIGLLAAGGGIAATVGGLVAAASNPKGGEYTIFTGIIIVGLGMTGKGIYGFKQYNQLKQM